MRNDRTKNSNPMIQQSSTRQDCGPVWSIEEGVPRTESEKPSLKLVKDIAELWLQADLDKRNRRKVELENMLAQTLAHAARDTIDPIGKIFQHVIRRSVGTSVS